MQTLCTKCQSLSAGYLQAKHAEKKTKQKNEQSVSPPKNNVRRVIEKKMQLDIKVSPPANLLYLNFDLVIWRFTRKNVVRL